MLGAIVSLGGSVVNLAKGWLDNRGKVQAAKAENEARLLASVQSHNAKWEMASLASSGKGLKWASFALFSFPLIWAIFDPEGVATYFNESIAAVPDWWVQTYMAASGSIWGISVLKDAAPQLVGGIRDALKKKKEYGFKGTLDHMEA